MPKKARALAPFEIKRLTRPGLYSAGGVDGLQLQVKESGARSWILRAMVGDLRRDIGLGGYPDVTLEQARDRAREARDAIRRGVDPVAARQAARDALRAAQAKVLTFDEVAKMCHAAKVPSFKNVKHGRQWINTLTTYASPKIGTLPVALIDAANVVEVLQPIWTDKTETASRVRERIEAVLAYATVNGYRTGDNPARWKGNLDHALPKAGKLKRTKRRHHPALPFAEVGEFMRRLREREAMGSRALEFLILTAARTVEVRLAEWSEFDLEAKVWTVPASRMKAGLQHRVPLSEPALALLKALPRFKGTELVFPGPRGAAMSENTLLKATSTLIGKRGVPHGFRSSFKDWCRSSTAFADEVSELALAHVNNDETRAAYARDELMPKRARLMRDWARYCGTVPKAGNVIPLTRRGTR